MTEIIYEGRDLEVLGSMPKYYAWIMSVFGPHVTGRVVEYGAGIGNVSELLVPQARELTLVEPSRPLIGPLTRRFAGMSNVKIEADALESHVARTADASFDTAILVNVLEHIEDDSDALSNLFRILAPGGRLLIFVPAMQWLMSELDRQHGHFRRYHKPDLTAKVAAAGGQVLHCRYFDLFGVAPWLLLNTWLGATTFNSTLVGFHDRLIVPLSRSIESIVFPPLGKNLILVAAKP